MIWKETGNVLIVVTALMSGFFVLLYGTLAPWYRTPEGRNIMGVMGTMFVGLSYYGWAAMVGGTPDGLYPTRAILFAVMATFLAQRIFVLIKVQLLARKESRRVEDIRQVSRNAGGDARDGGSRRLS